jgi:hypothetical protein
VAAVLVLLFVAERAHQWQSLLARDWSIAWRGGVVPRRAVLGTALLIGWGEGLGFYVQSERAFWAMIFWVYVAHVILTGWLALRSAAGPLARTIGTAALAIAALAAMAPRGSLEWGRAESWLGHALVEVFPRGSVPSHAFAPIAFVILVHALPCFAWNLWRSPPAMRLRNAATAVFLALAEWWLVAKSVWFPDGSVFPDLVDWWDLGHGTNFFLHPLWMAPFLAHVAIDAVRFFQAEDPGRPS